MKKKQLKFGRMYLVLREDLTYKYIQGAHALANFAICYPSLFNKWDNKHLICLSVFNGVSLNLLYKKFRELPTKKCKWAVFKEPDLNHSLTAICFYYNNRKYDRLIKKITSRNKIGYESASSRIKHVFYNRVALRVLY